MLCRPCVDCGRYTGCYCDGDELGISGRPCLASDRVPGEAWAVNQRTTLCTNCDRRHGLCHFCRARGVPGALECIIAPCICRGVARCLLCREGTCAEHCTFCAVCGIGPLCISCKHVCMGATEDSTSAEEEPRRVDEDGESFRLDEAAVGALADSPSSLIT